MSPSGQGLDLSHGVTGSRPRAYFGTIKLLYRTLEQNVEGEFGLREASDMMGLVANSIELQRAWQAYQ